MGRPMPKAREAMRKAIPVETDSMDAEMRDTMGKEMARVGKAKMMYAPGSMAGSVKSGGSSTAKKRKKYGIF